jgi:hypothetical protein
MKSAMKSGDETGPRRVTLTGCLAGITIVAAAIALAVATVCCGLNVPLGVDPGSDAAADQGDAQAAD